VIRYFSNSYPQNNALRSNGVVPVSSQTGYPGALIAPKMVDCNHMQERNHAETKDRLNELFNGMYGEEFKLDEI